ncbi:DUF262 domain-containing protein [Hoeflea alexandrii]
MSEMETGQDGVSDDAAVEHFSSKTFTITSYGADYPVDALVKRMKNETYFVPPFQRLYVWSQRQASRFIESLLLGLPVPGIFVFKEENSSRHLIIDGQQRLKTLQFFYQNSFKDKSFRLIDVRDEWEGKTYDELADQDRQRLDDSIVHTTIFRQESPDDNQSIYEVFERINSGGMKLSAQEIRSCVNFGTATNALNRLNENVDWRKIFGKKSNRLKDQELVLRFLALGSDYDSYKKPMSGFLNGYMEKMGTFSAEEIENYSDLWNRTISFCREHLGAKIFRPGGPLNAAVFDSVTVAISQRIEHGNVDRPEKAIEIYRGLIGDEKFKDAYERGTSDEERVKLRINMAINSFSELP